MKRLDEHVLRPGDIILTSAPTKTSAAVRKALGGPVSHAMLYVQDCSVIDSAPRGVKASNTQRLLFGDADAVTVLRLRKPLSEEDLERVVGYARTQIDVRYSRLAAARSLAGRGPSGGRRQFCSRLVAQSFAAVGILFHEEPDYCSPQHLLESVLLHRVELATVPVSEDEAGRWRAHPDGTREMWRTQDKLMGAARRLDPSIESIQDLAQRALDHPEDDERLSRMLRQSGYLDVWRFDCRVNPWHYDLRLMMAADADPAATEAYCVSTVGGEPGGESRYRQTLAALEHAASLASRRTLDRLIGLYRRLCELEETRVGTAHAWLRLAKVPGALASGGRAGDEGA